MNLSSAIVLFLAIGATVAVDYCGMMRCGEKPHVACANKFPENNGWGPSCPADRKLVKMSTEVKQAILDAHNKLRNQQAAGETPNYGPASRMGTLVWDDGLAKNAEHNVRSCVYGHDKCRNTDKWYAAGQNIAKGTGMVGDTDTIVKLITGWFIKEAPNGRYYGGMDMINNFQGGSSDPKTQIGHFTQYAWQDASAVGCAIAKYTDSKGKQTYVVCDYGFGNMQNTYVYEAGPAASKCKTGPNPDYPALCSVNEDYTEDVLQRSAWSLKPNYLPDGSYTYSVPDGCEDDPTGACQKMLGQ